MKANELMIGNWVECTYWTPSKQLKVAEIRRIMDNEIKIGVYSDDLVLIFKQSEVKPIPLTPEILEKNGFITNDEQGNWNGYRIYSLFNTNKSCIFMLKLYEKDSTAEISLDMSPYYIVFKFVHQLQHALRLCGIEKEIIL